MNRLIVYAAAAVFLTVTLWLNLSSRSTSDAPITFPPEIGQPYVLDADTDHGPIVYPSAIGRPETVRLRYEAWKTEAQQEEPILVIPMNGLLTYATAPSEAAGEARFDLTDGTVHAEVAGLPAGDYDLWLLDQQADSTTRRLNLGRFASAEDGISRLESELRESSAFQDLRAELVSVVPAGKDPSQDAVITGSLALFQRLYLAELAEEEVAKRDEVARAGVGLELLWLFLGNPSDYPGGTGTTFDCIDELVAKGEFLFFNETFKGNGRTCGTCHPAENNLTIDQKFIAQVPNKDPLFLAEFDPDLNSDVNGGLRFEIPELMRKWAVIVENVDGFGNLKKRFAMRSVPHVFAQGVSITNPPGGISPPTQRTGWSGDGSPFGPVGTLITTGSLRDFPVGAVRQHFPKTLNRVINVDFRLPTPSELDAMEAFQLSLGRQADLNLSSFTLLDPVAEAGRTRFIASACNACHNNAGANVSSGTNFNFDTGVEEFLQNRINDFNGTGQPRPPDGGFGTDPAGGFTDPPVPNPDGSFGDMTFNTPSIVEAADTPPFFHNNISATIEEAVDFYRSAEFVSRFGNIINAGDVTPLSAFLRVINAIDNLESSAMPLLERACCFLSHPLSVANIHDIVNRLLRIAHADMCDSIEVLKCADLHDDAIEKIRKASCLVEQAMAPLKPEVRCELIKQAHECLKEAIALMRA